MDSLQASRITGGNSAIGRREADFYPTPPEVTVALLDFLREDIYFKYSEEGKHYIYGWHISELKIYDRPKDLGDFTGLRETKFGSEPVTIKRPPQSWCYVEEVE